MASHESCFNEFSDSPLPEIIYLDTSFFIDALVDGQKYHVQSIEFIGRLAQHQPIIIFSELLISEIRCAVLSICIRNKFGPKAKVINQISINPDLVKIYYPEVENREKDFCSILQRFKDWTSVPLDENVSKIANKIMPKYRLGSYDAIHLATMELWNIKDIAVFDRAIEDLPRYKADCSIWTVNGWNRYKTRHSIRE